LHSFYSISHFQEDKLASQRRLEWELARAKKFSRQKHVPIEYKDTGKMMQVHQSPAKDKHGNNTTQEIVFENVGEHNSNSNSNSTASTKHFPKQHTTPSVNSAPNASTTTTTSTANPNPNPNPNPNHQQQQQHQPSSASGHHRDGPTTSSKTPTNLSTKNATQSAHHQQQHQQQQTNNTNASSSTSNHNHNVPSTVNPKDNTSPRSGQTSSKIVTSTRVCNIRLISFV
jgi:hypothetical protein